MLGLKFRSSSLLLCIIFIISSTLAFSPRRNSSRRAGTAQPRSFNSNEDYSNIYEDDIETSSVPVGTPGPLCQYDLCKDQQDPCEVLAQTTGCSCPGRSSHYEVPDPPHIRSLDFEKPQMVVVRWCAPTSAVIHYVINVSGQNGHLQTGERRRMMELGNLAPGTEVCVQATNRAGLSAMESRSCAIFEPRGNESGLALRLALIFGAVALVLLLALGLLVWKCRQRKTVAQTENRGASVAL